MKTAAIVAVFLLGCAVGGVSQFVVPPVRAGTNPTRWEYNCFTGDDNVLQKSDKLGAEGWEMVTALSSGSHADHLIWCFKRPR